MMRNALFLLVFTLLSAVASAEAPPADKPDVLPDIDRISSALAAAIERLVALQQDDGSWKDAAAANDGYVVGRTALASLALMQGYVYLARDKAELCSQADAAIHKGVSFIVQRWPEPRTYSAGLVQQMLFKAGASRYRKVISMYGWMLVKSQMVFGPQAGAYNYELFDFPKDFVVGPGGAPPGTKLFARADNSNTQFAALGLYYSDRSGFQVPKETWARLQKYYVDAQHTDGSWDYQSDAFREAKAPDLNMTFAGALGLSFANETLEAEPHEQCKPRPASEPLERGLGWIARNFHDGAGLQPYGWYACERLGTLTGYSQFGGVDWYQAGSAALCKQIEDGTVKDLPDLAFSVFFLGRGMPPIAFNKLKRTGDWNLHPHDLAHVADYLSDRFEYSRQWRIVDLNASVDYLLRVPILWISGHDALAFTDDEKKKLKQYVEEGGTILAEACCSKEAFGRSFRALVAELWPDRHLEPLPADHTIYDMPRPLKELKPRVEGLGVGADPKRLGVLYLPKGISCQWERGGTNARPALDVAVNIFINVQALANHWKTPAELKRERLAAPEAAQPPAPKD